MFFGKIELRTTKDFCYEVNNKLCLLRIDTSSDISIINSLVESCKPKIITIMLNIPRENKFQLNNHSKSSIYKILY